MSFYDCYGAFFIIALTEFIKDYCDFICIKSPAARYTCNDIFQKIRESQISFIISVDIFSFTAEKAVLLDDRFSSFRRFDKVMYTIWVMCTIKAYIAGPCFHPAAPFSI